MTIIIIQDDSCLHNQRDLRAPIKKTSRSFFWQAKGQTYTLDKGFMAATNHRRPVSSY